MYFLTYNLFGNVNIFLGYSNCNISYKSFSVVQERLSYLSRVYTFNVQFSFFRTTNLRVLGRYSSRSRIESKIFTSALLALDLLILALREGIQDVSNTCESENVYGERGNMRSVAA